MRRLYMIGVAYFVLGSYRCRSIARCQGAEQKKEGRCR
jgi:hypothetical protein